MTALYAQLASQLASRIEAGIYQVGERLPGIRSISRNEGVSPATAVAAYRQLEQDGYLEARPRSGFFVKSRPRISFPEPRAAEQQSPQPVSGQGRIMQLLRASSRAELVQLGAAVPDPQLLATRAVEKALVAAARQRLQASSYEMTPGLPALRRQIARLMSEAGCAVQPDDIVITNGCQEAMFLALKHLCSPGDVVALESPTFYGLLQVVDSLGLKALEIPSDPATGISLDALQLAFEQWPVKACVLMPNFANPLGSCMPDASKQRLLALAAQHKVTLVEDDIYGDLSHSAQRPGSLKRFDQAEQVIHCSSFSKTLAPGLRLGWIASRRYAQALAWEKYLLNTASPTVTQLAVAQLLESGRYQQHLRSLRLAFARSVQRMLAMLDRHFPAGTRVSRPTGGFVLWVELPGRIDTEELAQAALAEQISIVPGTLFSASGKYRNYLRLSCGVIWSERVERAVIRLAELIKDRRR